MDSSIEKCSNCYGPLHDGNTDPLTLDHGDTSFGICANCLDGVKVASVVIERIGEKFTYRQYSALEMEKTPHPNAPRREKDAFKGMGTD